VTENAGSQFFGQFLVSRGVVGSDALEDALDYQKASNIPLGALGLSKGLLSERQVLQIHTLQRRTDMFFGEIAVQRGFLAPGQLDELLREQAEARVLLGEALVQKEHLSREQLNEALVDYHASQAEAEGLIRYAMESHPEQRLLYLLSEITSRMLLRMAHLVSKVQRVESRAPTETSWAASRWFASDIEGDKRFTAVVTLSDEELLHVARAMLARVPGAPRATEVDELVLDVGREFVNLVVEHICSQLAQEGVEATSMPARRPDPPADPALRWTTVSMVMPTSIDAVHLGLGLPPEA
jgi:hypothetical protein